MQLAGMIGGQEIIIIFLIVLVLFGGKKIPELMKGLGNGVKEYKNAVNSVDKDLTKNQSELKDPKIEENKKDSTEDIEKIV